MPEKPPMPEKSPDKAPEERLAEIEKRMEAIDREIAELYQGVDASKEVGRDLARDARRLSASVLDNEKVRLTLEKHRLLREIEARKKMH